MITPRQIDLVQDSFAAVVPVTASAADAFYRRLFEIAPDTRALFRGDMAEQGRKLFLTLATIVDALDRLDRVLPAAHALAVRHIGYGVREEHYAAVGEALIDTLAQAMGDRFDPETAQAWAETYELLAGSMIAAARGATGAAPDDPVRGSRSALIAIR